MNRLFALTIMIVLALAGCTEDNGRPTGPVTPTISQGFWLGTSWARYPGPADEPLEAEEEITFYLDDSTFYYFRGRPDINGGPDSGRGFGTYLIAGDTLLSLTLDSFDTSYPPFHLDGDFGISWDDSTLILLQIPPSYWMTRHRITVNHTDVVF